jgi:maleylacetoacetate isomerase
LADICLVPQIYNAVRWGVDVSAFPVANAINGRLEALDAFRAAHPDVANAARS